MNKKTKEVEKVFCSIDAEATGKRIKMLMEEKGLSQADLARKLNMTPMAVSKWVRGMTVPSVDTTKALTKIFECSYQDILVGNDELGEKPPVVMTVIVNADYIKKYLDEAMDYTEVLDEREALELYSETEILYRDAQYGLIDIPVTADKVDTTYKAAEVVSFEVAVYKNGAALISGIAKIRFGVDRYVLEVDDIDNWGYVELGKEDEGEEYMHFSFCVDENGVGNYPDVVLCDYETVKHLEKKEAV